MGVVKTALVGTVVLGVGILAMKMPTKSTGDSAPSSDRTPNKPEANKPEASKPEAIKPEKRRPDTPEARKEFVNIIAKRLPQATIATEGSRNEGLVIDLKNCYETINELLNEPTFTERLDQFQFKWVRCPSAKLKITPPWR